MENSGAGGCCMWLTTENGKEYELRGDIDTPITIKPEYDDISLARAVVLKGTTPSIGYAEKVEMEKRTRKPVYIPPAIAKEVGRL